MEFSNLPAVHSARLPDTYLAAKTALAECSRIDECQDWADKAEALASYARQSQDDGLRKLADRIQARAIRRAGELLKTFDGRGRPAEITEGAHGNYSQAQAAREAGLSEHQQLQAVRVANVPQFDFESAVESDNPPTITALAEQGKKPQPKPLVDIGDRDPKEFALSTDAQGQLRRLAEFAQRSDPAAVARGALPHEVTTIREHIGIIDSWLDQLFVQLEANSVFSNEAVRGSDAVHQRRSRNGTGNSGHVAHRKGARPTPSH